MDDFGFILHSNKTEPAPRRYEFPGIPTFTTGTPGPDMQGVKIFQLVPTAFFVLTEKLVSKVGESSWLYHLWNLLFHLGTACFAFTAGRNVLTLTGLLGGDRERTAAALTGAVLFACHPLCSEALNYAKCLNSITVAMFGMMAVSGASKWLISGGRGPLWMALGGMAGATLSYFPGMTLATAWLAVLVIFRLQTPVVEGEGSKALADWLARYRMPLWGALAGGGALLCAVMYPYTKNQFGYWAPLFPSHLLTQGRLLWEYLSMTVVPVGLCSDHHVPWSIPGQDGIALAGLILAGVIVLACAALVLIRTRTPLRGWALLVLLALLPLVMRFVYVNAEHFVEYRAYPAVPWLMLMAGTGLVALAGRFPALRRLPLIGGAVVAVIWILLSIQRTQVWSSRESLVRDVLRQYPLSDRALTQLQDVDLDNSNYTLDNSPFDEIRELHGRVLGLEQKYDEFARSHPGRRLETSRLPDSVLRSYQFMVWAVAYTEGSAKALEWADRVIAMLREKMPEQFVDDKYIAGLVRAWPLLSARDTVAAHRNEIDAAVKERAAQAAAGGFK
jgi:hypothetical protein